MSIRTWTLTDVAGGIHQSDFSVGAEGTSSQESAWKVTQRTLRGGLSDGVDVVVIDNGKMCLHVLPTRGMGIWQATSGEDRLGWQSPVRGPVHPKFVPLFEPSGLGWLEGL